MTVTFEFRCFSDMSSARALYFDVSQAMHRVLCRVVDVCQFCVESLQLRGAIVDFFKALVQSRRLNLDVVQTCRAPTRCMLMFLKQCIAFCISSLMFVSSARLRSV